MAGGKLKAFQVTKVATPGMYGDGGGLYLQIAELFEFGGGQGAGSLG